MFIQRNLTESLRTYASKFRVVALIGPRQAGKTTLVQEVFPEHKYFSLEDPDTREMMLADPRDFLEHDYNTPGIILDEFQNEPKILSYIQGIVDRQRRPGYFVLTGSHNFLMNQAITQSLAGRVAILTLLPLALNERNKKALIPKTASDALFFGGYPDIITTTVTPEEFYPHYVKTYVERDVRQLINITNLTTFQRFMRLCAGRTGQLLNVSSLADDCGISVPTVNAWLSILQASFVIFLTQPYHNDFRKRLIKSPKLYFYDTGLACWLLKIDSAEQVHEHYLRGGLFESLILSELHKRFYNVGKEPNIYFWRDSHGNEIDCVIEHGTKLIPLEIKSSTTLNVRFFEALHTWCSLAQIDPSQGYVVYGGNENQTRNIGNSVSWKDIGALEI